MNIVKEYEEKIPTWALSYIVNNDYSGITEEDKEMVDRFMNKYQRKADMFHCIANVTFPDDIDAEKYFAPFPAFGLACDVVDCKIIFMN